MIYTYYCEECENEFDKLVKSSDQFVECNICGSKMIRKLSAPNVHFKGTGFYETDYKRRGGE